MKLKCMVVVGLVLLASRVGAGETAALETPKERMSYGIGVEIARNFRRLGLDLDVDALIQAMRDVYSGGKLLMSEEDLRAAKAAYQDELR